MSILKPRAMIILLVASLTILEALLYIFSIGCGFGGTSVLCLYPITIFSFFLRPLGELLGTYGRILYAVGLCILTIINYLFISSVYTAIVFKKMRAIISTAVGLTLFLVFLNAFGSKVENKKSAQQNVPELPTLESVRKNNIPEKKIDSVTGVPVFFDSSDITDVSIGEGEIASFNQTAYVNIVSAEIDGKNYTDFEYLNSHTKDPYKGIELLLNDPEHSYEGFVLGIIGMRVGGIRKITFIPREAYWKDVNSSIMVKANQPVTYTIKLLSLE